MTYGRRDTFLALSMLYEDNNWGAKHYHVDHIVPRALLTGDKLAKAGVDPIKFGRYWTYRDSLGNLELLSSTENQEKSDSDFAIWLETRNAGFRGRHLIPEDTELMSLDRFDDFVRAREDLIRQKLESLLT